MKWYIGPYFNRRIVGYNYELEITNNNEIFIIKLELN